jgi:creatinine amidohydrolase/Fe(II)-dependent formamide hydrolase-like protein
MTDDNRHLWAELTTEDVADLAKDRTVVVQPIGAVEQHGPHLPLITDALTAETIAREAVRRLGADSGTWVLPTLHYGKSTEHLGRAGTIALSTNTLQSVCLDLGESLAASGVRKLVFVNGHGGQPSLLDVVARDIRHRSGLEVFSIMPSRFGLPDGVEDPDPFGIHGGFLETSLVMAIAPHLVHPGKAVADGLAVGELYRARRHLTLEGVVPTAWLIDDVSASGVVGDPAGADAGTGKLLLDHWSGLLAEALAEVREFAFPPHGGATA